MRRSPATGENGFISRGGGALALSLAALVSGCGGGANAAVSSPLSTFAELPPPASAGGKARWFPMSASGEPRYSAFDPDGRVRVVERGLRFVEFPDGRIERAGDLLPESGALSLLSLPARLGGGYLFQATFDGATRLYTSKTFTGPLTPVVRLPFEAAQLAAGFDRLYAVSGRNRALVGVDVRTGAVSRVDALPRASAYGAMAFADGWVGAVETDVRGVLVTFDAGASWHSVPVPMTSPAVLEQGGRIVLGTTRGLFALEPSGELERVDAPGTDSFREFLRPFNPSSPEGAAPLDEPAPPPSLGPLSARALERAVLRGIADSADTALVVENGVLARVALADGKVVATSARAVADGAACTGVRLFSGVGFVCGRERGPTAVYAYRPPLDLVPVMHFGEPRAVLAGGTGGLAIGGGCGPVAADSATYCIVSKAGARREVRVLGDNGAGRIVALADGRAAVIVPPRLGVPGSLSLVERDGKTRPYPLDVSSLSESARELALRGLWLHGFVEDGDQLAGWVAGSGPFVGIRVGLKGKVEAGLVRANIERANLSGLFGLARDLHGGARETADGGLHWNEIALPSAGDDIADAPERERGCSSLGCSIGTWIRVGWGGKGEAADLSAAPEPPKAKIEGVPFVSWSLECAPAGQEEGPGDVADDSGRGKVQRPRFEPRARTQTSSLDELESSGWRTFLGVPAPERAPGDLGFDFGTEDQLVQVRGYAWGARDAAWDRAGSWLLRGVDRFSVQKAVWSTAVSRTPWADAAEAADAFGSDPSHRVSSEWSVVMDPMNDAGILWVRTTSLSLMAVAEKDRPVVVVRNSDEFQIDRPAGAVKALGKWYLGATPGVRPLQVLALDGANLSLVGTYPRYGDDAFVRVVRTARGDAVGIWVIGRGQLGTRGGGDTWFIHPIDSTTGAAGEPLTVAAEVLARPPRPCEAQEDGWVLIHEVSPSIGKVEFVESSESPSAGRLEARLVAGPNGLCIDSFAAQVDGDPPKALVKKGTAASRVRRLLPLALTDRATDRRFGFRCSH